MTIPFMDLVKDVIDAVTSEMKQRNMAVAVTYLLDRMGKGAFDVGIRQTAVYARQMRSMGFAAFRSRWAYARQLLPLQLRLLLEQVLWSMGPPWRTLLTGFNPIELGDVGLVVPFSGAEGTPQEQLNVEEGLPGSGTVIQPPGYVPPPGGGGGSFAPTYRKKWKWSR